MNQLQGEKMEFRIATLILMGCASALPLMADVGISQVITDQAPRAIGPYSQATRAGSHLFISGQIALDPVIGQLVGTTIEEQTAQVLKNIEAILVSQGLSLENVLETEVFLKDLKDFGGMNGVYAQQFTYDVKPARATVQVAALPRDALIEIRCTAFIPSA
jgi:2-iminobutanoate/2-iminopropanoate deaminase